MQSCLKITVGLPSLKAFKVAIGHYESLKKLNVFFRLLLIELIMVLGMRRDPSLWSSVMQMVRPFATLTSGT